MIDIFDKALKLTVMRKLFRNIKATVMSDKQIVVEKINEVCNLSEAFTLHNNEGTD